MSQPTNPRPPPLPWHRRRGACGGTVRHERCPPCAVRRRKAGGAGAIRPGTHTSFAGAETDRCRRPQCRLRRSRARRWSRRSFCCTAGPTTSTALSMSPRCWRRRGFRVIVPYLRGYGTTRFLSGDTLAQRPAGRARHRRHRPDGCARDRQGGRRRLRLGRADRRHRRGALAGARARRWSR